MTASSETVGRRAFRQTIYWLGNLLTAVGILVLLASGAYWGYAQYSEHQVLAQFGDYIYGPDGGVGEPRTILPAEAGLTDEDFREVPLGVKPPATRIRIPKIGLDSNIVELSTRVDGDKLVWETANNAVGHHQGTANPGEGGNAVFSGHISSPVRHEGEIFKHLPEVRHGDEITLVTDTAEHRYRVTDMRVVDPNNISAMKRTGVEIVTLITCVPDYVYTHRLVVTAMPIDPPAPGPAVAPAVPTAEATATPTVEGAETPVPPPVTPEATMPAGGIAPEGTPEPPGQ